MLMNTFVVVGGLLVLAVVGGILYPLLRRQPGEDAPTTGQRELNLIVLRDQLADLERDFAEGRIGDADYQQAREELERRALDHVSEGPKQALSGGRQKLLAAALAIGFPVAVGVLYWTLGAPETVAPVPTVAAPKDGEHALSQEQILAMVENLALRLQENPNDGRGWLMLARSYAVLGRYPESAAAFSRALGLLPPEAQHYADFADIVAMTQGKKLAGEPERLVRRALEIDPRNVKALALAGTIAFDRQDYAQAIGEWQKVLALLPEQSPAANSIQGSIRDAQNRMAIASQQGAGEPPAAAADKPAALARVAGIVELDPKLRAAIKPGDTLFVFARAVDGPKMPVAMLRAKAGEMPLRFALDDSMSMAPQFKLSTVGQVVVGARISKSGDALARAGDLEGLSAPVSAGAGNVKIVINSVVP
ncbi:MAG: c-type cytochrome biogenesis protein CcmI [Betaproteobacteria bacterium HGW-Betaproteobacteria-12]|nr:MAG: c-type cytochrome biogenesis protein CcmI [Betaproteobacteria bacterium HGW-Betaproteobacteria-12]